MSTTESARLDRIEHHLKILKEDSIETGGTLKKIEHALIGTDLNGKKGIVNDIEEIKKTFNSQSNEITILKNELDNAKFWGKLTATGLVMGLIGLIFKVFAR